MSHIKNLNRSFALLLVAIVVGFRAMPARADDASCKPITDAMTKMAHTPYHETATAGGRSFEKIHTTTALYLGNGGHWIHSDATPQDLLDAQRESGISFSGCKVLRTDTVDGHDATVYAAHSQTAKPPGSSDAQIWIGDGLLLKSEADEVRAGRKTHTSTYMSYDGVQAPAGAR